MNRRGFIGTILALGCAPAIVKAASLMPVRVYDGPVIWTIDQSPRMPQMIANANASYRQRAHDELANWLQGQLDESAFRCLTPPNKLLATIPYGEGKLELYSGRAPELT